MFTGTKDRKLGLITGMLCGPSLTGAQSATAPPKSRVFTPIRLTFFLARRGLSLKCDHPGGGGWGGWGGCIGALAGGGGVGGWGGGGWGGGEEGRLE